MEQRGVPKITWAVLTMQDSDGKVSVLEIPAGNHIQVESEIFDRDLPDISCDGVPPWSGSGVPGRKMKVTIEVESGRSDGVLVMLRGHG